MKYQKHTPNWGSKWSESEVSQLKELYPKLPAAQCSKIIGRTVEAIKGKAHKMGLMSVKFNGYDRRLLYDKLTDLSKPSSCYLLGLIWADGRAHQYGFSLGLESGDMEDVEDMIRDLGTLPKHIRPATATTKQITNYSACSKHLARWLSERGYQVKCTGTPTRLVNEIPPHNRHYFFRGWFDGDGCWGIRPQGVGSFKASWSVSGAYKQDWKVIEDLLNQLGLPHQVLRETVEKGGHSCVRLSNSSSITLLGEYVYRDYQTDQIGFQRKHDKWVIIKNRTLESRKIELEHEDQLQKQFAFIRNHPELGQDKIAKALCITRGSAGSIMRTMKRRSYVV